MATNFPASLDALTNPTGASALTSPDHAGQHTDANDAIEAIEAQIGTTASPVLARLASPTFTGTVTAPTFVGALSGNASTVTTNANLTGHITSVGNAAVLGSFTSAQLASALTDETGTGANVFAGSPTLTGTVTAAALTVTGATTSGTFAQGTDYLSPYQGLRNLIINGAMNIWQRATDTGDIGVGGGGYYGVDRWWLYNNGYTSKMTRQPVGSTLPTFLYCMRFQRTLSQTSIVPSVLHTPQETINSVRLAGKQATLSFYARASSGMSNTSGVSVMVNTGTGTDQKNFGASSYTGGATPITTTPTLTTSWQRFTVTGTIASTTTEIDVQINYVPAGTAGASDYFEITGIQLEEGSVATPFEHRPYATELTLCERYFESSFRNGQTVGHNSGNFTVYPSDSLGCGGNSYFNHFYRTRKRSTNPSLRVFDSLAAHPFNENWWRYINACNIGIAVGPNGGISLYTDDVCISGYLQASTGVATIFDWTIEAEL